MNFQLSTCQPRPSNKMSKRSSAWLQVGVSNIDRSLWNLELITTPWKINMELAHDGLEDDFPFQLGDF